MYTSLINARGNIDELIDARFQRLDAISIISVPSLLYLSERKRYRDTI